MSVCRCVCDTPLTLYLILQKCCVLILSVFCVCVKWIARHFLVLPIEFITFASVGLHEVNVSVYIKINPITNNAAT